MGEGGERGWALFGISSFSILLQLFYLFLFFPFLFINLAIDIASYSIFFASEIYVLFLKKYSSALHNTP